MKYHKHKFSALFLKITITVQLCVFTAIYSWAQKTEVTLATANWEPIFAESLPNGGVLTELTVETCKKAGFVCKVVFVPWKRAVENAKSGDYDGIMGGEVSDEFANHFAWTNAIAKNNEYLYVHSDSSITYPDGKFPEPYKVGLLTGSISIPALEGQGLRFEYVTKYEQNLKKLIAKRIDLMLINPVAMAELLKKNPSYQDQVKRIGPPIFEDNLHILISKKVAGYQTLIDKFNSSWESVKQDGTFESIIKKHGFTLEIIPKDL
ncbi:transporter substrate-binding domain-containing protein [Zooshikella marina]|uniref:substrate-binding periplasmic protein n=1 Tax=Zooshikella ganghwensis TaxID=202772 RepID=UPI001BB07C98|nr:transporter substrate-binding domain-containing protein [Zooshikella ganghwensis]MBU2706903.1 transporter substrate-binding domain-containing protein [Zooshikella ganghwensis]